MASLRQPQKPTAPTPTPTRINLSSSTSDNMHHRTGRAGASDAFGGLVGGLLPSSWRRASSRDGSPAKMSSLSTRLTSPLVLRSLLLLFIGSLLPSLFSYVPLPFILSSSSSRSTHLPPPPPPPFVITPSQFSSDPLFPPSPSSLLVPPDLLPPRPADGGIPNIVHYVFGYKEPKEGEQKGEVFPYYAYLAVRSALVNLKPERIFFHYKYKPRGPFWDLLEPSLTLLQTPAPEEIYGRKLSHFAHKSDVIRLQALRETGGIYLDIDVFVTRPFTPLLPFQTVLGMEASPDSRRTALEPAGLCNAVILSQPDSRFLDRWLDAYKDFDSAGWADFSVKKPWELARRYPDELTVLSNRAFFWPLWEGSGEESRIRYVHEESTHSFSRSGQFAYHAWESLAMNYLSDLTPESVRKSESSFGQMVKKFVTDDDDEAYRKWKAMKS